MRKIALGIDDYLDDFAELHSARTWKHFVGTDPEEWENFFAAAMNEGTASILFNLDGIQVWVGVSRASSGRGGPTDRNSC